MLAWFLETTLVGAVLAVVAYVVSKFGRLGPAARHILWLVVLVKMVTPPLIHWPFAVESTAFHSVKATPKCLVIETEDEPEPAAFVAMQSDVEVVEIENSEPQVCAPAVCVLPSPALIADDAEEATEEPVATVANFDFLRPITNAWLAVTIGFAAWQITRIVRFSRKLRGSKPLPEWLEIQIDEIAASMGVRAPQAIVSDTGSSPYLWCAGPSTLVIPKALLGRLDAGQWEGILAHELAHLRRGDPWICRLSLAAGVIWWWNPLYWFVKNRLETEAELACDGWAVWSRPEARRQYAETLVDVCELTSLARYPSPALGVGGTGKFLERRLIMILQGQESCRLNRGGLAVAAMLAILSIPSWTQAQQDPAKPPTAEPAPAALPAPPAPPAPPALPATPAEPATTPAANGVGTITVTNSTSSTTSDDGVEVRVVADDSGKPKVTVNKRVYVVTKDSDVPDDLKQAYAEAQANLEKARAALAESQAKLRAAEGRMKASEYQQLTAKKAEKAAAERATASARTFKRDQLRIQKDGKDMSPEEAVKQALGSEKNAAELAAVLSKLKGLSSAASAPKELDALNHRMDSLEKKLDLLLDELKSGQRPPAPARPGSPARRAPRGRGAEEKVEKDDKDEEVETETTASRFFGIKNQKPPIAESSDVLRVQVMPKP